MSTQVSWSLTYINPELYPEHLLFQKLSGECNTMFEAVNKASIAALELASNGVYVAHIFFATVQK